MTNPIVIPEAYVYDKRLVRPGDEVKILPVNLRKQDEEHGDYFARQQYDFLHRWLGDGPFTISWIGQYPCGRVMLYLKGTKGSEPGAHAYDFM